MSSNNPRNPRPRRVPRQPRPPRRGGTTGPRFGRRGYWGYMGSSPVSSRSPSPSAPGADGRTIGEEINGLVAALMEDEDMEDFEDVGDDHLELPLIHTGRDSTNGFSLMGSLIPRHSPMQHGRIGGYPDSMFMDLSDKEKEAYECNICFLIVREPLECRNKHVFCAACISRWSVSQPVSRATCPVCRADGRYTLARAAHAFLLRREVRCPHGKEGDGEGVDGQGVRGNGVDRVDGQGNGLGMVKGDKVAVQGRVGQKDEEGRVNRMDEDGEEVAGDGENREEGENRGQCTWSGLLMDYKDHEKTHIEENAGQSERGWEAQESDVLQLPSLPVAATTGLFGSGSGFNANARRMQVTTTQDRLRHGRARIQAMLAQVRAEMEEHERNVQRMQEERERQRRESLMEVHSIGNQLGEVADGLIGLLNDIRIDSRRCNDYIRALRRGDGLPEVARNITQTLAAESRSRTRHPAPRRARARPQLTSSPRHVTSSPRRVPDVTQSADPPAMRRVRRRLEPIPRRELFRPRQEPH